MFELCCTGLFCKFGKCLRPLLILKSLELLQVGPKGILLSRVAGQIIEPCGGDHLGQEVFPVCVLPSPLIRDDEAVGF